MTEVARPRRLPAEERRRAIVEAALRVFSSGSYAGSTTAEIAREAGVSEPVLYRHFASKRDLWVACLDVAWEEFRDGFDAAIATLLDGARQAGGTGGPRLLRGGLLVAPSVAKWKKALMPNLWIQGITEAGEDREIRRQVARHMGVVHDHVAGAIRLQTEATKLAPDVASYWNSLGMTLGGNGKPADAERAFREAVRLDAKNHRYAYNLGLVLRDQGRPAEARPWFERALALDPRFTPARERLREIGR